MKRIDNPWGLTKRQCDVIAAIAAGKQAKQIARELFVDVKTIEQHAIRARKAMSARNSPHAAALWAIYAMGAAA